MCYTDNMQTEKWLPIKGYEGIYEVSSFGRVKSLVRKWRVREIIRKPVLQTRGYLQVELKKEDNTKVYKVHRLVAQAFLSNVENKKQVNHIDGIKTNNRFENLEWTTQSENMKHASVLGLMARWGNHHKAKLTEKDVIKIRSVYANGSFFQRELAEKYKVSLPTINLIINNKRWKNLCPRQKV